MADKPKTSDSGNTSGNLFQRAFAALRAGFMFGESRDMYKVYGYPRVLQAEQLLAKYERQDITARVCDTSPEETWAYPPKIITDEKEFTKAWDALRDAQVVNLWAILLQADKLLNFGAYSVIWIGLPGSPESAATRTYKPEQIAYMQAYGAQNVSVVDWEKDTLNPRYGMPNTYQLKTGASSLSQRVHYTRTIHMVDRPLQGQVVGNPRMAVIYNLLDDILKIGGGSAETYWLTANRGMQIDVDKDMDLKVDDAKALSDELDEFQHQLRRFIRTRGVTITPIGSEVADPSGPFGTLMSLLSSATGIPQRILMGAEAGQLASAQDRANFAEFIDKRRINFAEPYVLGPTVARLRALGILPPTKKPIEWEWPSAFHQSPLEVAQTQAQFARSVVNLSRQTQYAFPVATLKECRRQSGLPEEVESGDILPEAFVAPVKAPFGGAPAKEKPAVPPK